MTAPAYPTALVTLEDAFDHLNIDDASVDAVGDELKGFIAAATEFVEYQTGPIIPKTFTEVHSGGGLTIVLDNPPILSISAVTEYIGPTGYPLTAAELGAAGGMYAYSIDDPEAGIICRRYYGGLVGRFAAGYRNVIVTYTAGRATVPADIRMAVLEDIRGLFTQTQYSNRVGTFGAGSTSSDAWAQGPANPVGTFPRLAALLAAKNRTPSIA